MKKNALTMLAALCALWSNTAQAEPEQLIVNVGAEEAKHGHWGIISEHAGDATVAANSGYIDPRILGKGAAGKIQKGDKITYQIGTVRWRVGERRIYVIKHIERNGKMPKALEPSKRALARIATVKINEITPEPPVEVGEMIPPAPIVAAPIAAEVTEPAPQSNLPAEETAAVAAEPSRPETSFTDPFSVEKMAEEAKAPETSVATEPAATSAALPEAPVEPELPVSDPEPTLVVGEGKEKVSLSLSEINAFTAKIKKKKAEGNLSSYLEALESKEKETLAVLMKYRRDAKAFLARNALKIDDIDVFADLEQEFDAAATKTVQKQPREVPAGTKMASSAAPAAPQAAPDDPMSKWLLAGFIALGMMFVCVIVCIFAWRKSPQLPIAEAPQTKVAPLEGSPLPDDLPPSPPPGSGTKKRSESAPKSSADNVLRESGSMKDAPARSETEFRQKAKTLLLEEKRTLIDSIENAQREIAAAENDLRLATNELQRIEGVVKEEEAKATEIAAQEKAFEQLPKSDPLRTQKLSSISSQKTVRKGAKAKAEKFQRQYKGRVEAIEKRLKGLQITLSQRNQKLETVEGRLAELTASSLHVVASGQESTSGKNDDKVIQLPPHLQVPKQESAREAS